MLGNGSGAAQSRRFHRQRVYRPRLEELESRLVPASSVNFAVIGDYGVASSILNIPNLILGAPDPEGDVARLVHSWNPDFILTVGDNNYLCGEEQDANLIMDLELLMLAGKLSPSTAQSVVDTLASIPFVATSVSGGSILVANSTTINFTAGTDLSQLSVGMYVVGPGILPPSSTTFFLFNTITAIDDTNDTITLNIPTDGTTPSNKSYHFLPADLSLTTLDGLSHIDRNIGRYFSDYIYPYVPTSPPGTDLSGGPINQGQFGNGSPTGFNRFFPVPGNHDWADLFSNNNFADSQDLCALVGITGFQLDAYLKYFRQALSPQHSPGFKMGTFINGNNQIVPLTDPYYYSFTVGTASDGRPLIEFFAFDSELADPMLNDYFVSQGGTDYNLFTNVDTILSQEGKWLQRAMAASTAHWKIPYFHHTPYTSSGPGGEEGLDGFWMRLPFQQWGADAVLYGHVHNYERFSVKDPAIPQLNIPAGTVPIPYIMNGFGGAPPSPFFGPIDPNSQLRYNGNFGAQRVMANEHRIIFQFINISGGLIDQYVVQAPMIVTGTDQGAPPRVRAFNAETNQLIFNIRPYEKGFRGGVRVATGDVNGDGAADIIVAPGRGRAPLVRVYDGASGQLMSNFLAYGQGFRGGVFVAAGDLDGNGVDEIIVGPGSGKRPVRAFTRFGTPAAGFTPFFPYGGLYTGGIHVAAGNADGIGVDEIVTAPAGAGRSVRVFNSAGQIQRAINAFARSFRDGIWVALGDIDGNGSADVVAGPGAGRAGRVRIFSGATGGLLRQFYAFGNFTGGVRVGTTDIDNDHLADVAAVRGPGAGPLVKAFDGLTAVELDQFFAFERRFSGGLFAAGS